MGLELKQNLKLTQNLIMTPQLQQAIKLLQLSRLELIETIKQELESNPTLEDLSLATDTTDYNNEEDPITTLKPSSEEQKTLWEDEALKDFDWHTLYEDDKRTAIRSFSFEEKEDEFNYENFLTKTTNLTEHLLWQLRLSDLDEKQMRIGEYIIGNINQDGYLEVTLEDILKETNSSEDEVKYVLNIIQNFDPIGVGARDLVECLMIQAKHYGIATPLVKKIIEKHLSDIEKNNYNNIIKSTKASQEEVSHAIQLIKNLDPKPGRVYADAEINYITPDLYLIIEEIEDTNENQQQINSEHKNNQKEKKYNYIILFNDDGIPSLGISNYYRKLIEENGLNEDTKLYIKDRIKSAEWLIKSINHRRNTLYKITKCIIEKQKDFFEKGVEYLKPLVIRDVAEEVQLHESTVSRAITNKYIMTPVGLFELKYFFQTGIKKNVGNSEISAETVKQKIKQFIENEDPENPLKDIDIVKLLEKENITVARRTVAKYREQLGILPVSRRKKPKI